MKKILAIAVATAISAPAMADLTISGVLSMDYINKEVGGVSNSQVQKDDYTLTFKGSSATDAGLNVGGELVIADGKALNDPTLANISVSNDTMKFQIGKISNPANAADIDSSSDSSGVNGNTGHFSDEINNAIALSFAANGFSASVGAFQDAATKAVAATNLYTLTTIADGTIADQSTTALTATADVTELTTTELVAAVPATDNDGMVASLSYSANGFTGTYGYETLNGTKEVSGLKVAYAADDYSVSAYSASTDVSGANVVDTVGVSASYKMGNTSVRGFMLNDDYATGQEDDVVMVGVTQVLGGGLKAYAEYTDTDSSDNTKDANAVTLGMSYSF